VSEACLREPLLDDAVIDDDRVAPGPHAETEIVRADFDDAAESYCATAGTKVSRSAEEMSIVWPVSAAL